jgi:hypothetical protein
MLLNGIYDNDPVKCQNTLKIIYTITANVLDVFHTQYPDITLPIGDKNNLAQMFIKKPLANKEA